MNKKLILLPSFSTFPAIAASCLNTNKTDELKKLIDKNSDVIEQTDNDRVKTSNEIIEKILDAFYAKDEIGKIEYLKSQNDDLNKENFFKNLKEYASKFKKTKSTFLAEENLKKYEDFLSDNLYLVLKNIDKFVEEFYQFVTIKDSDGNNQHSQEYINHIKSKKPYESHFFENNYLDKIEKIETHSVKKKSFFILKDKSVFKIDAKDAHTNKPKITLYPWTWYFAESLNSISLNLLSSMYHIAALHSDPKGYEQFEQEIVKKLKYGIPAKMVLIYKES